MSEPKAYKAKLEDFKPDPRNLNRHTQRGRGMVEASQRQRGYARPAFAAQDGTVLGGNLSTMEVAPDIGLGEGEVFVVETDGDIPIIHLRRDVEPGTEEAVLLAAEDNQSALISIDFNPERLAEEIAQGVDFSGVFTEDEQAGLLAGLGGTEPLEDAGAAVDKAEALRQEWGTELGQIWVLGEHRLAVGDCTDRGVVEGVMRDAADVCLFTDPPYGVKRDEGFEGFGGFGGFGPPIARKKYSGGWDEERPDQETFSYFIEITEEAFIFGGNFFADILPKSTCWLVWDKLNTMPTFGDCELLWTNLNRKSVKKITFEYNGLIGKEAERFHATQKPLGLILELVDKYIKSSVILDPFLGSGTTLIACEQLGRRCRGIEIDPGYAAVTLQRFFDMTGVKPELIT